MLTVKRDDETRAIVHIKVGLMVNYPEDYLHEMKVKKNFFVEFKIL